MRKNNTIEAFFALVQGGLWEREVLLQQYGDIDYEDIMQIAEEQLVVGIVTAGLEHVHDERVPQEELLQFIGQTLQIEQNNISLNDFLCEQVEGMRRHGIYTLLVKGQGIALCYDKPLWRYAGDIDFYLSNDNFQKAKQYFKPLVDTIDPDDNYAEHINMHWGDRVIEIHSNQHSNLASSIDCVLDEIHADLFYKGEVRSCIINKTQVFLPNVNHDVVIIFTHFLKHFYKGGLGVRQICDWCRLMWTYRDSIDHTLLEKRLKKMGLMNAWKAFAAFAVDYLGMPSEPLPFYDNSTKWRRKAEKIKRFIIEAGNYGHNRKVAYDENRPRIVRKALSYIRHIGDLFHHASIFPLDSFRFFYGITYSGMRAMLHGE